MEGLHPPRQQSECRPPARRSQGRERERASAAGGGLLGAPTPPSLSKDGRTIPAEPQLPCARARYGRSCERSRICQGHVKEGCDPLGLAARKSSATSFEGQ